MLEAIFTTAGPNGSFNGTVSSTTSPKEAHLNHSLTSSSMSTKKEKWNFENLICKLPHCRCMQQSPCTNHHYSDECFSTIEHSQSESIEWEKEFDSKYIRGDFGDVNEKDDVVPLKALKDFIRDAITTAVAKRVNCKHKCDEKCSDN